MSGNITNSSEAEERTSALVTNANAVAALAAAIEGTLGPKGLFVVSGNPFPEIPCNSR